MAQGPRADPAKGSLCETYETDVQPDEHSDETTQRLEHLIAASEEDMFSPPIGHSARSSIPHVRKSTNPRSTRPRRVSHSSLMCRAATFDRPRQLSRPDHVSNLEGALNGRMQAARRFRGCCPIMRREMRRRMTPPANAIDVAMHNTHARR
nr:hypothetical protein CFP56_30822 [Quercus suber]